MYKQKCIKPKSVKVTKRCMKRFNQTDRNLWLAKRNVERIGETEDVEEMSTLLSSMINSALDECAQYKTFNIKPPYIARLKSETRDILVEELSQAGQVSQPVRPCVLGLGDLCKLTAPAYFFGVKLMFFVVVFFSLVQLLRFVVVKNFQSCSKF